MEKVNNMGDIGLRRAVNSFLDAEELVVSARNIQVSDLRGLNQCIGEFLHDYKVGEQSDNVANSMEAIQKAIYLDITVDGKLDRDNVKSNFDSILEHMNEAQDALLEVFYYLSGNAELEMSSILNSISDIISES